MHHPIPVSRPSWEDKNPAGICLLPPQVLGKLLEGGSWAASALQSAVPKGGTDTFLRAASPGRQPGHPAGAAAVRRLPVPRYPRGGERRAAGPPDTHWGSGISGRGSGHCSGRELPAPGGVGGPAAPGTCGGEGRGQKHPRPPRRRDPVRVLGAPGERDLRKGWFPWGRRDGALRRVWEGHPAGRWADERRLHPCPRHSAPPPGSASRARCRPLPAGARQARGGAEERYACRERAGAEAAARTDGSRGRGEEPGGAAGPGGRPGGRESGRAARPSRWGAPARARPRGAAILSVAASGCGEAAGGPGGAGHGTGATGPGSALTAHALWKTEVFRELRALNHQAFVELGCLTVC